MSTTTTTTTTSDSPKPRLCRLDDVIDPAGATEGWRLPTADGPEGYVNEATCWTDGVRFRLRADLIHEGALGENESGVLGTLHEDARPALLETRPLMNFAGGHIVWVTVTAHPDGQLVAQLQGGSYTPGADGLAYLSVEIEYLLASAV